MFFINAALGIILVLSVSGLISNSEKNYADGIKKFLIFFGNNSLVVMISHYYFTRRLYPFIFANLGLSGVLRNIIVEIILFVITLLIELPIILILNKYFYFVFGKPKPQKGNTVKI